MSRTNKLQYDQPREAGRIHDVRADRARIEAYGKRELSPGLKVAIAFAALKPKGLSF